MGYGIDPITFKEESYFYLYWLCKLVCNSSKRIIQGYAHIAMALAKGRRLTLSSFVLAILYRCLFNLTQIHFTTSAHDTLWLL